MTRPEGAVSRRDHSSDRHKPQPAIDVAAWVGNYPFRGIINSTLDDLRGKAEALNMRFVVASFDSLFHENNLDAFERWQETLAGEGHLEHWPVANPDQPGQLRYLEKLLDRHQPRGLRLLPNYHAYRLWHPEMDRLMAMAAERGMIVQIFQRIADERWHWMLKMPAVSREDVDHVTSRYTDARVIVSGCAELAWIAPRLRECPHFYADISRIRGPVLALEHYAAIVPLEKMVFGSLWPIQMIEASLWQITWSQLTEQTKADLLYGNFARLTGVVAAAA